MISSFSSVERRSVVSLFSEARRLAWRSTAFSKILRRKITAFFGYMQIFLLKILVPVGRGWG